mgnify:CR=1 FL=1
MSNLTFYPSQLSTEIERIKNTYDDNGWVVIKSLIPDTKIDGALEALERIKTKRPAILTQNSHEWTRPVIENGQMIDSIQSPSKHLHLLGCRQKIIDLTTDSSISNVLTLLSGHNKFIQWQDMLFDKSTGTADHFDSYYLDTFPIGQMTAAWIALEDIHPDSGPFFTVSQTKEERTKNVALKRIPHAEFVTACHKLVKANRDSVYEATLQRGDVLFWNSLTLHGAKNPIDENKTRKSVTCHFYPVGIAREKKPTQEAAITDANAMKKTRNPHIFLSNSDGDNHLRFTAFGLRRYIKESFTKKRFRHTLMNRSEYDI